MSTVMLSMRTLVLTALFVLPLVAYLALGAFALWQTGWFGWTFWILPVFWLIAWLVSKLWNPRRAAAGATQETADHYTVRDTDAASIIRRYQDQADGLTTAQLTDPQFYLQQALLLSRDIAAHYHPDAQDPVSSLTVPEVLAATRLAVDDMERWMLDSVPGSRLVTIAQWRWLQHAPKWIKRIQDTTWAASVLVNPANILKYLTSEVAIAPITQELQAEFLAVVYLRFIRQTGFYLVEMNSGRLRGGADVYRITFGTAEQQAYQPGAPVASRQLKPESLTVAIVGQVKAGKSSLVNALLGKQVAKSDVLPETRQVARYQLGVPDSDVSLTLLDTPGYADAGATKEQLKEVKQAARQSDILLLVMAANSPARSADRAVMDELQSWRQRHPELRPSPVIICLTHIDLLSPMMEWSPPYHWQEPDSKKAQSIHDAVGHVRNLFSDITTVVIPVCSDVARGRSVAIFEELLPALMGVLTEGQMAAILRTFHENLDRDRFRTVLKQLQNSGMLLLKSWMDERLVNLSTSNSSETQKMGQNRP